MHRVDADGHSSNLFTDGNPGLGVEATVVDDDILNAFQEEIANSVEMDGTALVKGTNTQLRALLAGIALGMTPGGRVTLSSGNPVAEVTDAATVYYTPFKHTKIMLWNGTIWVPRTFAEMSQALSDNTKSPAAAANNTVYDMYVWMDGSTMRFTRGAAWASHTSRGTGGGSAQQTTQNGRVVNAVDITNGPAAGRGLYVGTIYVYTDGNVDDATIRRGVWNFYNRVKRVMIVQEATNSWNYTTDTWRQANNSSANQLDFVTGYQEDIVEAEVHCPAINTNDNVTVAVGIGVDSSTVNSAIVQTIGNGLTGNNLNLYAKHYDHPSVGRHTWAWLERSAATGTTSFYGDANIPGIQQSAIHGSLHC
jgi:hypothetical protein